MALMKWSDDFCVGVAQFDEQHKQLMAMVNDMYDGMMDGSAKDRIDTILDSLIAYTDEHFRTEESVFARTGYPEMSTHRASHNALKERVIELRERATQTRSGALTIEMSKFLKDWLLNHIQKEDKSYGPYLNAKGVY